MLISSCVLSGIDAEQLVPDLCTITFPVPLDLAKFPPSQEGEARDIAGEPREPGACYRIKTGTLNGRGGEENSTGKTFYKEASS